MSAEIPVGAKVDVSLRIPIRGYEYAHAIDRAILMSVTNPYKGL